MHHLQRLAVLSDLCILKMRNSQLPNTPIAWADKFKGAYLHSSIIIALNSKNDGAAVSRVAMGRLHQSGEPKPPRRLAPSRSAWVEASPSCSYDNMLLLSQALMVEQQKPFHPFSLVPHGNGRRRSGRWVFQRGMDVCACVHMCWLFEIKFDLFFCWNMKLGPLKWSVYNVAFAENDLEFLDIYEVTDRPDIWKLYDFLCNYGVHLRLLPDTPVNLLHIAGADLQQ